MRKSILAVGLTALVVSGLTNAEYYKVNVKREDSNLYINFYTNIVIKTKFCYEYVYNEDAVLIYDKNAFSNQLVFKNGSKCDVDWIAIKQ